MVFLLLPLYNKFVVESADDVLNLLHSDAGKQAIGVRTDVHICMLINDCFFQSYTTADFYYKLTPPFELTCPIVLLNTTRFGGNDKTC